MSAIRNELQIEKQHFGLSPVDLDFTLPNQESLLGKPGKRVVREVLDRKQLVLPSVASRPQASTGCCMKI